jgi:hypothetical protein
MAGSATRGQKPCPHTTATITETDSKTYTEHQDRNAPARHKHLKSLVLPVRRPRLPTPRLPHCCHCTPASTAELSRS